MLRVAVVVPTYQRRDLLVSTLDSLERLHRRPDEVVVVSDGSTDGSDELALDRGLRLIRTDRLGAAGARNAGWRATNADVVAFTDDDCAAEPQWLDALLDPFLDESVGIVQGRTAPAGPVGPFDRTIDVASERGLYESCNIAYRRGALEVAGGFDESFAQRFGGRPFGEDTDLAWRVRRSGWRTAFADDAVVRHHVFAGTFADTLREQWRLRWFPTMVHLYPELREQLPGGRWFLRRQSAAAQLLLVAPLVAVRSRTAAALLALPYAAWLVRRHRRPGPAARQVARDIVASAALLRGSIAARTPLL